MRWWRHLFAPSTASRFPAEALQRIAEAIARGERSHTGQVCFAVEAGLSWRSLWRGLDARRRAETVFSRLRVWDTAANNGVLVYLLLADHRIELVADRGVAVDAASWAALCERMAQRLRNGEYEGAVIEAVDTVSGWLATLQARGDRPIGANELSDRPTLLD